MLLDLARKQNQESYEAICKRTCRESNSSSDPYRVHPDLIMEKPNYQNLKQGLPTHHTNSNYPQRPLPDLLVVRILRLCLCFPGQVVHAISRLDPWHEPEEGDIEKDTNQTPRLLRRLHVGLTPISLTYATKPEKLLAPLLVSRAWNFWGSHLFYGENTFAFSSLGEWGRFAAGIGRKVQRLQHIELVWTGSQFLTFPPTSRKKYTSRRTEPLAWLPQAKRLKSLKIFVSESSKRCRRRNHEPEARVAYAAQLTQSQPDYRLYRDLNMLQGLHYIRCLRGIETIKFYDYTKWFTMRASWLEDKEQFLVRNKNFSHGVAAEVVTPKDEHDYWESRLRNLPPLLRNHEPTREEWETLQTVIRPEQGSAQSRCFSADEPWNIIRRGSTADTPIVIDDDSQSDLETSDSESDSTSLSNDESVHGSDSEDNGLNGSKPEDGIETSNCSGLVENASNQASNTGQSLSPDSDSSSSSSGSESLFVKDSGLKDHVEQSQARGSETSDSLFVNESDAMHLADNEQSGQSPKRLHDGQGDENPSPKRTRTDE
ncbi:hypothetical protein CDD81_7040 [Ophiocordyceps australis]|uniref:Uncharacterized protein n=1 Tax=Ophiocordyceps australis TaxID=1399860 RepID=A0A2C5YAN5_9HYPO|nr:hypothetical protein CDD81_7040 [Ophiocordyceps australis]